MPSVLITGANGFIGSHLCDAFLAQGCEVFGLVRRTSDLRFLKDANVHLLYGDLNEICSLAFPKEVDVIVHAAALVSDNATLEECRRQIYQTTTNLVERAMQSYPRLKKLVYISTALTLGYCADGISETNPGKSADYVPYNLMKKKAEEYVLRRCGEAGFPAVVLRPGDVYGPRDRTSCELMLKAAEKGRLLIVGSGRAKFGFCYPDNLCRAVLTAVEKPGTNGRAYTVTNRVSPTWREFFAALQAGVGRVQRFYVPVSLGLVVALLFELLRLVIPAFRPAINLYRIRRITTQTTYDLSKTEAELGYESDEDYQSQFKAIVAWYRQESDSSADSIRPGRDRS